MISTCLDQLVSDLHEQAIRLDLAVDGFLIPTRDLATPAGLFSVDASDSAERAGHNRRAWSSDR